MITLERFSERHLDFLAELVVDPLVLRFTRVPDPPPPDFARTWLESYRAGHADGSREGFVAVENHEPVGIGVVVNIDRVASTVELGYVVAENARGRGLASVILRELTDRTVAELDPERIQLLISTENIASSRAASRCGYTLDGVLRNAFLKPGYREDTEVWSLIRRDRRRQPPAAPSALPMEDA